MAPQLFIEYVYFIIIAIIIGFIIAFYILTQRGGRKGEKPSEEQTEKRGMEKGEKRWMFFLFTVLVIGNILMLSPLLPSAKYAFWIEEKPALTITIEVRNYEFILPEKPITIPVGVPVEFIVRSADLVYGFGVFRKDGLMVFQMQVVPPPYVNRIIWVFDEPGYYDIRSTEYSGPKHPYMYVPDAIHVVGR
jgi:cytochrome c oxidase subunit 2